VHKGFTLSLTSNQTMHGWQEVWDSQQETQLKTPKNAISLQQLSKQSQGHGACTSDHHIF